VKDGEMGGTFRGRRKMHTRLWRGDLKERDQLKNISVDGRRILKLV
jgi:hypothetical protein